MTMIEVEAGTIGEAPAVTRECWDDDLAELRCVQVQQITHDVRSFVFAPPPGQQVSFKAGQFITLQLEIDGGHLERCYTISSPPTRPDRLSITVKRVAAGPVSNWLHDTLRPGARLTARAPSGGFTLGEDVAERTGKYLFLSAGSGITPLMSMTRTLFDLGSPADVLFVHSARSPADIVFRRELDAIASVLPSVRVMHVCESDHPADRWPGLRGRLTAEMVSTLIPDLDQRTTYVCGPAGYMASVRQLLDARDYDMTRYHEESFSFEELPFRSGSLAVQPITSESESESESTTGYLVEFARSGRSVPCGPGQTILDAALAAGLRPPSSCTQGMCGTCKTVKLGGEVDMRHNGGIRPKEIAQGKILLCCSRPLTDLQLDA